MEQLRSRDPIVPFKAACEVLGIPRSTAQRHLAPPMHGPRQRRSRSPRKLAASEEQRVLDVLHSGRFQDQAPRQVYAELLDEGTYLASPSASRAESRSRCRALIL